MTVIWSRCFHGINRPGPRTITRWWNPLLGHATTGRGRRQRALADYAGICGLLLAKSHARTSGASMIAGYLGRSEKVDRALCRFARAYADQVKRDYQALLAAVARGVLPAEAVQ